MRTHLIVAFIGAPLALNVPALAQTALPDVSQLEYRGVTLEPAKKRLSFAPFTEIPVAPIAAHLWVAPARGAAQDNDKPAFGLGWDGAPYEITSVGDKADWRAEVERYLGSPIFSVPRPQYAFKGTPLARQFLRQLGATELEAKAVAQYHQSVDVKDAPTLYIRNLRNAGVSSFVAGQFSQSKRQLQTLLAAKPALISANLRDEARLILNDIERREREAPRPEDDEIAGLIWDLQNVRAFQMSSPGDIGWTQNPTVQKLINSGDGAVEPLLNALQNDARLTLSARLSRGVMVIPGSVGTVRDAAQAALEVLLKHQYYSTAFNLTPTGRAADVAAQMRADWEKVKGQTPQDRVFNALMQSGQAPQRLEEAARELVRVGPPAGNFAILDNGVAFVENIKKDAPFWGEPLRARQNPSVSDALEARIIELSRRALSVKSGGQSLNPGQPNYVGGEPYAFNTAMATANGLALVYAKWEPQRALPLLSAQLERTKIYALKAPRGTGEAAQRTLQSARRQFLLARLSSPFRAEALSEYGEFLAAQPFGRVAQKNYAPLWRFPDEPALIKAAHALFDAPRHPFESAATWKTGGFDYDSAFRLLSSPLVKNPIFKAAIERELKNKTVVGVLRATKKEQAEVKVTAWDWSGQAVTIGAQKLENGATQPLRVCDLVGFWLVQNRPTKAGQDQFYPALEVALPTAKRDARLKQIAVLVAQGQVVADDLGFVNTSFG